MNKCERDARTDCEIAAGEKKLAGAAKTSFTNKCVKDLWANRFVFILGDCLEFQPLHELVAIGEHEVGERYPELWLR